MIDDFVNFKISDAINRDISFGNDKADLVVSSVEMRASHHLKNMEAADAMGMDDVADKSWECLEKSLDEMEYDLRLSGHKFDDDDIPDIKFME